MKVIFSVIFAVGAATSSLAAAQEDVTVVAVEGRTVILSDLAVLPETIADQYGPRTVVKFSRYGSTLEVTEARRRQLVRRQLPALQVPLRHIGRVSFQTTAIGRDAGRSLSRKCFLLTVPMDLGSFLELENVAQTQCQDDAKRPPLRYIADADALVASRKLEAGEYLGAIHVSGRRAVAAGSNLRLVSRDGPVIVSRGVTLLQATPLGSFAFVRTEDGEVFSAALSQNEEQ